VENLYDHWADVYDDIYAYLTEDKDFYLEWAKDSIGPVLELGCGTGRITIPIVQNGVDIVGIDISPKMIEVAKKNLEEKKVTSKIDLLIEDMRDFQLNQKFSLIIIPFRGFLSLLSVDDQINTLASIKKHMHKDTRLVFDIFVPKEDIISKSDNLLYYFQDVSHDSRIGHSEVWHKTDYDLFNQRISSKVIVDEIGGKGKVINRYYKDFEIRYIHRWEMFHLLNSCGFKIENLYGTFSYESFDENSNEMIWVVKLA
tara:strand:- start:19195 stop:19962 length:768 start_codon:yes stop_codon:yes gene_type:complete